MLVCIASPLPPPAAPPRPLPTSTSPAQTPSSPPLSLLLRRWSRAAGGCGCGCGCSCGMPALRATLSVSWPTCFSNCLMRFRISNDMAPDIRVLSRMAGDLLTGCPSTRCPSLASSHAFLLIGALSVLEPIMGRRVAARSPSDTLQEGGRGTANTSRGTANTKLLHCAACYLTHITSYQITPCTLCSWRNEELR